MKHDSISNFCIQQLCTLVGLSFVLVSRPMRVESYTQPTLKSTSHTAQALQTQLPVLVSLDPAKSDLRSTDML